VPPRVEYALTEMGKGLGPSMAELIDWAFKRREVLKQLGESANPLG
jgi:DNA-binding HxlR family transcriptional regulator